MSAEELVAEWEALGTRHAVGGHELFVADVPADDEQAPPVLVLHGFPSSGFDWRAVLPVLRARRRVVIPDLLGYGLSDKPDQRYTLFEQADLVAGVVRALALEEVALVTHDMGDTVGGELLARSLRGALGFGVERRVVSNGSIYIETAQLTDGQQMLLSLPDEAGPPELAPAPEALAEALRATFAADADVDADELAALGALAARDEGTRLLPRLVRYIEERRRYEDRWTGAIEAHPAPLTIVWGDLDPIAVWPMAERLRTASPDATLVRLDGVGHYPMVEAPGRFGAALRDALA